MGERGGQLADTANFCGYRLLRRAPSSRSVGYPRNHPMEEREYTKYHSRIINSLYLATIIMHILRVALCKILQPSIRDLRVRQAQIDILALYVLKDSRIFPLEDVLAICGVCS